MLTAAEARKLSNKSKKNPSLKHIEDSILDAANEGGRSVLIDGGISTRTRKTLEGAGYKVSVSALSLSFRVEWSGND